MYQMLSYSDYRDYEATHLAWDVRQSSWRAQYGVRVSGFRLAI